MRQAISELAVVGNEDQPLTGPVEPADGKNTLLGGNQIDDARAAARIEIGRDDADGLIDREVQPVWLANDFAIHADFLGRGIDPRAQFGDGFAVDLDSARGYELFA